MAFDGRWKRSAQKAEKSEEVRGAKLAGSSPPLLSRERAASAVSVDVMLIRSAAARATNCQERRVGFIEITARRHRRGG